MFRLGTFTFVFLVMAFLVMPTSPARADCSSPAGVAGQQIYNSTYPVMQYCNGTDWIPMWGTQEKEAIGGSGIGYPECTITSGQMTTLQTLNNANFNTATSMSISDNVLFLGTQANNKLVSVNIDNPSNMKFMSFLATGYATAYVSAKDGRVATSAGSGDRVVWSNVSNPGAMSVINSFDVNTADSPGNFAFLDGTYDRPYLVFPSLDDDRVMIFEDMDRNGTMALTGSVTNATTLDGVARIAASGNYIYASVRTVDRLTIIDATNKAAPVIVGSITDTRIDDPAAIDVQGNYVYVPSRVQNRLNVIDVSNPTAPTIVGSLLDAQLGNPEWVVVRGKYAFVGSWLYDRVLAIDVSNPTAPAIVDSWQMPGGGAVSGIPAFKGSTMFIGSYDTTNNIHSVDLGCDPEPEDEGIDAILAATATCLAGYTYNPNLNGCYKVVNTAVAWAAAKAACNGDGAFLIKMDSIAEETWANAVMDNNDVWIGLNDISVEGTYTWENGEPFTRTNWYSGEPNNADAGEDCGELWNYKKWADSSCGELNRYICETKPTFPAITCDPGYYFLPATKKCVKRTDSSVTWPVAKTACEADDASLPIILSRKEDIAYSNLGARRHWIGLTDAASEQYWQWINGMDGGQTDGDRDSYTNWNSAEPNANADYVSIYEGVREWDDSPTAETYFCTKDPEEICNPEHHGVREAYATGVTSVTMTSYAVPDIKDRILFVTANEENANTTLITPTTATFNGVAMTRIAASTAMLTNNNSAAIFYLINPPAVTGNIVVNYSGTATSAAIFASVVNCLAQQAPEAFVTNSFTNATETGRTFSTSITTLTDNAFLIDSIASSNYGDFRTLEPDQLEPNSYGYSGGGTTQMAMGSRLVGPAGSHAMSWYHPTSSRFPHVVAAFKTTMAGAGGDNLGNHSAIRNLDMNTFRITNAGAAVITTDGATKAYVDGLTGAAETDPKVGAVTNDKFCRGDGTKVVCDQDEPSVTALGKYAVFADQQINNTNGGTPVAGAWTTRTLNTSLHNTIGASLASSVVTLPSGVYYIDAVVPFQRTGTAKARLVNASNTVLIHGSSVFCTSVAADGEVTCYSHVRGVITLSSSTALRLQYYVQTAGGAMSLGDAAGIGSTEQYATMMVQKID
jgi:hypothetical protein